MARWGEEDKKSQGIGGCLFAFAVLGLVSYTFYVNYPNMENKRDLEKRMQTVVRAGYQKTEAQMIGEILDYCEEENLDVTKEDIELAKTYDDHYNPVVDVYIKFNFQVNLLVTEFEWSRPISEKLVIVVL